MCQRPKRALSISTGIIRFLEAGDFKMCQRPKRALSISTIDKYYTSFVVDECQRPKRALSISTGEECFVLRVIWDVSTP